MDWKQKGSKEEESEGEEAQEKIHLFLGLFTERGKKREKRKWFEGGQS
jgi:hypothetical protein